MMGEATLPSPPVGPTSYPSPQQISSHITLQAPLSRRGKGPSLILVLDHYALLEASEKHLDPPPLQKWAEEGFAVVQLLVPGKTEDGGELPLDKALKILKECDACIFGKGVGVVCEYLWAVADSNLSERNKVKIAGCMAYESHVSRLQN